ncbi:hypothetical protein [Martelella radicis]|uniref:Uncharacterized protein n=1 Tax=Martelella radicis TaxID=1397476 RepID=A0A7W6KMM9_9HYPH|nr:hypothetical protein [Martelella radicis]MBB4122899.1 hypothetical protein [Martelella radicis]
MIEPIELKAQPMPPALNIHIEPDEPIELANMLVSLEAIGRRYKIFATNEFSLKRGEHARLFVSSIKPGSIDISLIPDIYDASAAGIGAIAAISVGDATGAVASFGQSLKALLNLFDSADDADDQSDVEITVQDCNDAINIVKPTAEAGGSQTFNVYNIAGDAVFALEVDEGRSKRVMRRAVDKKEELEVPSIERFKNVALIWKTFDRSAARVDGSRSPDKAIIEEISDKPKSVLFGDDQTEIKSAIISDDQNLLKMVYYVDVEVVTARQKIAAYRIVGYHGKDALSDDE